MIKNGKSGVGQQVSGGCQGARRKKSDRRSSPAGAALFVRGEAYPLRSSRKLLGGSLFPSAENVAPTHAFFFLCQGVRCAGSEKIILGSASTEASPCGIFSAPPRDTERKQPHPAPFFPITCSEMNSPDQDDAAKSPSTVSAATAEGLWGGFVGYRPARAVSVSCTIWRRFSGDNRAIMAWVRLSTVALS